VLFGPLARIESDGSFQIDNVPRETCGIALAGLPEGMYVKRARGGWPPPIAVGGSR